jgi:hypothetical protein
VLRKARGKSVLDLAGSKLRKILLSVVYSTTLSADLNIQY